MTILDPKTGEKVTITTGKGSWIVKT